VNDHDELRAIGERLLILAEAGVTDVAIRASQTVLPGDAVDDRYLSSIAQAIYAARRLRDHFLDAHLFGEPAWDMLLDLFIRAAHGKRTAVTSLCIASGVPLTTALRWIGTLQDAGLVLREEAEHDRRVAYLKLSVEGFAAVRRFLIDAARYVRPAQNFFLLQDGDSR
jgi:DNA-binding MarR family transcriptional regulator